MTHTESKLHIDENIADLLDPQYESFDNEQAMSAIAVKCRRVAQAIIAESASFFPGAIIESEYDAMVVTYPPKQ